MNRSFWVQELSRVVLDLVQFYKLQYDEFGFVVVADGRKLKITGKGVIQFKNVEIEMYLVPNLKNSVLSVSHLIDSGFHVGFK